LKKLPQPPKLPFFGHAFLFLQNTDTLHDYISDMFAKLGQTFYLVVPDFRWNKAAFPMVATINPANVEYILGTNFENFVKGPDVAEMVKPMFGQGNLD
jgi:hypothetical protein